MKLWPVILIGLLVVARPATAQLAPEIGYIYPVGGQAGTTIDVVLGGYDWTPDMQIFPHDPRIKIEVVGAPSPVLVPEPPYWFGAKARGPAWPLPREFPARITIPADMAPGLVRWQVANANGASPVASFHITAWPQIAEDPHRSSIQQLPALPVSVTGQVRRIEEIDRYEFRVPSTGPVTIVLVARQLGSPLHGMLQVRDPAGRLLVDAADTEGQDLVCTFPAVADTPYVVSLHDLDFAGDRSYVYRLELTAGPRVVAAFPASGKRGTPQGVEFVGWGLATPAAKLESVSRDVPFPPSGTSFSFQFESPQGRAPHWTFGLSDLPEFVEPPAAHGMSLSSVPCAVTGACEDTTGVDEYAVNFAKDSAWRITAQARALNSPLDLDLTVIGPDGKELATQDDAKGTTDPVLDFVAPADGTYRLLIDDRARHGGSRAAFYRLVIEPPRESLVATIPPQLAVPLGGQAKLTVPVVRGGGLKAPVRLSLNGLPEGIQAMGDLLIPADKSELAIDLQCAPDAPASANLVTVNGTAMMGGQETTQALGTVLIASVMKPRCKITPEGLDDVRKVHRGSTYLAPLLIERLEGYAGPITLEMTSKQQRHRQGLASDEFVVPPGATRVEYPIFVPEWMETTKTSRMILNGTVQVPDPRGRLRTLVQRMELRIGILPEGALLKLTHGGGEPVVAAGGQFTIPIHLARAPELHDPVKLELIAPPNTLAASAEPMVIADGQAEVQMNVQLPSGPGNQGEHELVIRATALKDGRWPVVAETKVMLTIP